MEYVIGPSDAEGFQDLYNFLKLDLRDKDPVNRESWQTLDVSKSPLHNVMETHNVTLRYLAPVTVQGAQSEIQPDLPWAEEHFLERVSGDPLNPPPSYAKWPHHHGDSARHIGDSGFDHTYPERFWPKHARMVGEDYVLPPIGMRGIRFAYGDLADVCVLLRRNLMTRQAYLPVWFPEDTGATEGQRVPCSLGYHFIYDPQIQALTVTYMIRSCDLIRHFRNDIYMAVRLQQWMCGRLIQPDGEEMPMGPLVVHIMNLHMMVGDANK